MAQFSAHGVIAGCQITAQASPDMTVKLEAGGIYHTNVVTSVAADSSITITAADSVQERIDMISVDNTGTVTVTDGTLADVGTAEEPLPVDVVLAYIYVGPGVSTITDSVIQDVRRFERDQVSPYRVSNLWYGPQGITLAQLSYTGNQNLYACPFFTAKQFDVTAIGVRVANNCTVGNLGRLGIYTDDGSGVQTLQVDAGTVALSGGAGDKTISISETIQPGWSWFAFVLQGGTATFPLMTAVNSSGVSPVGVTDLSPTGVGGLALTGISGSLPSSLSSPIYTSIPPMVWVKAA